MAVPPLLTLNNSVPIPQLGLGMYQVRPDQVAKVVATALEAGYRSIDTAAMYGNEAEVGAAVRESGLPREDVFVTTKVWNTDHGYDNTLRAFDRSAEALGLGPVDLYLIHWPKPELDRYVETWRALELLLNEGRVRAIGVSNFGVDHLRRLLDETDVVPVVNQVELHPWQQQAPLRAFHAEHGIATEAWSPLARGRNLNDRVITALAAKYGKTPAQLVLRWHLQLGIIAIPKSATPSRIRENADVFDFELAEDDLLALAELDS
ncbi:aldo/keto reductase [Amycolatopsis rubida]|uniref:Aldo/keto reductase n=1 Tax=Amycolatopsis rubida TaxID=112413 RepID=A0A1I5ZX65_9PSEU|nr:MULTISPECIES: aldo/keto reductase [Amycolatopsis]MYW93245.1 aldo/keto reductase [Amycolatopsis rubida]NEC58232.1 aldo/keto reductase [Amycolatopsis rubida]OAP20139.1 putative oxidoreductase [Amycolatopsis sp. M39]SFQ60982.1 Aldo/keto reductase [Amycolatopsis rubida]